MAGGKKAQITKSPIFAVLVGLIFLSALVFLLARLTPIPITQPLAVNSTSDVPNFDHIVVISEENRDYDQVVDNNAAPYINSLIKQYALAANYYGTAHPSLPNYLQLTSGTTGGIITDCTPNVCGLDAPNLADRIEESGRTWKSYAESMPVPCGSEDTGEYATKHNPFLYYANIFTDTQRCQSHIVPLTQLKTDLLSTKKLPNYAFITPNLCNDMHNCSTQTGDTWLKDQVTTILASPAFVQQNSLLVIVWDESEDGNNHIPAIIVGRSVRLGYESQTRYDHNSLLHTILAAWDLAPLTDTVASAPIMNDFFVK